MREKRTHTTAQPKGRRFRQRKEHTCTSRHEGVYNTRTRVMRQCCVDCTIDGAVRFVLGTMTRLCYILKSFVK